MQPAPGRMFVLSVAGGDLALGFKPLDILACKIPFRLAAETFIPEVKLHCRGLKIDDPVCLIQL